jgi:hypothetical protein
MFPSLMINCDTDLNRFVNVVHASPASRTS